MLSKALLKLVKSLEMKKFRKEYGLFVAEGSKTVCDLINLNIEAEHIIATKEWLANHKNNWIDFNAYDMDEDGLFNVLLNTVNGEVKCKSEDVREIAFYKTGVTL